MWDLGLCVQRVNATPEMWEMPAESRGGVVMGRHMNSAEQTAIWDRYENGETFTGIAAAVGRPYSTIREYVIRHGHRRPSGPPACSSARMSPADREEISRGLVSGESLRSIAGRLRRVPSTISREVAANGGRDSYRAVKAEDRVR